MRVAICMSGHMRTYYSTYPSLCSYLLSSAYRCDIFVHTWDTMGWYSPNDSHAVERSTVVEKERIERLYRPKTLVIEPFRKWDCSGKEIVNKSQVKPNTRGEHIYGMFYKVHQCNQLKVAAEQAGGFKYDIVVRTRPDILYCGDIDINKLRIGGRCVYVHNAGHSGGVNDQFAVASSESMDVYADCFNHLDDYVKAGCLWRPEPLLLWHLQKTDMMIKTKDMKYVLLRPNGSKYYNKGTQIGAG